MENEVVHYLTDNMRCWLKPKPAMTKFNTFLGRILITDQRFLFLSSGSTKLREQAGSMLLLGPLIGPLVLGTSMTDQLDLSDLANEGSIDQSFNELQGGQIHKRWDGGKYLSMTLADGSQVSFMKDPFGFNVKDFKEVMRLVKEFRTV